jgi:predicted DNA-binding transcriptional regulator AlpA
MSRTARPKAEPGQMIRIEPIAVDRASAAQLLGLGISTFEAHVSRGTLPKPRQLGGRAVWLVDELRATAQALPVSEMLPVGRGVEA